MEQQFVDALYAHDWYVVVALVLFGILWVAKKSPYAANAWNAIPDYLKWLVPVVSGAAVGFVDGFQSGLPWEQSLIRAVAGAFFIGASAMGVHSAFKGSQAKDTG